MKDYLKASHKFNDDWIVSISFGDSRTDAEEYVRSVKSALKLQQLIKERLDMKGYRNPELSHLLKESECDFPLGRKHCAEHRDVKCEHKNAVCTDCDMSGGHCHCFDYMSNLFCPDCNKMDFEWEKK